MRNLLREWQAEIKQTFTGTREAVPDWVPRLADGTDCGYHLPGSAVWAVHGDMPTIVAGIRALLMQALHPGALAGVHDHSRFREDPLGRLAGTIRWIFTVSYGSTAAARAGSDWVLRLHESVRGDYIDGHGVARHYAANDPELLRWVHIAFTDAFLSAHKIWGRPIPGGPDAYVREWAQAGELMGVESPPLSEEEMRRQMDHWYDAGELRSDQRVAETVAFIRNPPLHPALRPGYRVLFAAAVATLEPKYRELLGLRIPRIGPFPLPVRLATKVTLGVVHLALGRVGPSEQAARDRLRRLGHRAQEPMGTPGFFHRPGFPGRKKAPVQWTGAKRGEWGI
ncbi:oxygenase MpaB family protein [Arthrobacter ginsengisoli]|uniref:oxygenase MpaB family protein n=1 Tax=Arthrobacter ginsengisoli TaxID=1356565 RepID=UPI00286A52F5|nr:oxygenase MpaB family protein [Arthrobacter ginsengisoli]